MASTLTVDNIVGATTAANVKLPAGYVIQTQYAQSMAQVTSTITTLNNPTESGLNVIITPKYNTSKILLMMSISLRGDGSNAYVNALIKRNTTLIDLLGGSQTNDGVMDYAINFTGGRFHGQFLDSPATTSATTYKFCFTRYGGSGTTYFNNSGSNLSFSSMVAMEIAQ